LVTTLQIEMSNRIKPATRRKSQPPNLWPE
jgi:hypothetical protein